MRNMLKNIQLNFAEKIIFVILLAIIVLDFGLIIHKNTKIDMLSYVANVILSFSFIAAGLIFRCSKPKNTTPLIDLKIKKIARLLISIGLLGSFFVFFTLFTFLKMPLSFARIDDFLLKIDLFLGFSWADFVSQFYKHQNLAYFLEIIYSLISVQMVLMLFYLSFFRQEKLNHFLLTIIFAGLLTVIIWLFFPAFGPFSMDLLPQHISLGFDRSADDKYAKKLIDWSLNGANFPINAVHTAGLIAFPSFHIIMMASLGIGLTRSMKWGWLLFLTTFTLMALATLLHGGHHLIDLIAGMVVFGVSYYVADYVLSLSQTSNHLHKSLK